jgi:AbrB family looped-hinge helix DNA binding protein
MTQTAVTVRISEAGRIVIPATFRKALAVKPGDELILEMKDGELRLRTRVEGIRRAKALVADLKDGPSPVDELIAERRAEAARE